MRGGIIWLNICKGSVETQNLKTTILKEIAFTTVRRKVKAWDFSCEYGPTQSIFVNCDIYLAHSELQIRLNSVTDSRDIFVIVLQPRGVSARFWLETLFILFSWICFKFCRANFWHSVAYMWPTNQPLNGVRVKLFINNHKDSDGLRFGVCVRGGGGGCRLWWDVSK